MHSLEEITRYVDHLQATPVPGEERHVRRIAMLGGYERTAELPPQPDSALGREPAAATDPDA